MSVTNIRDFQKGATKETGELVPIRGSLCDHFEPRNAGLQARADELLPRAQNLMATFPPAVVAEMLAFAAARLERVGFKMFQ